jgi:hypothetical protein
VLSVTFIPGIVASAASVAPRAPLGTMCPRRREGGPRHGRLRPDPALG